VSWPLASFAILGLALMVGFGWYERSRPQARVLALVAVLAALAVIGRIAFAAIPNVKPTTDIVLFAGYALGGAPGFAVGALAALVSNVFLGQGPWTPWQMAGWGAVGLAGAGLARLAGGRELGRVQLAIACGLAGAAFGALLDVYQTTLAADPGPGAYAAVAATSLPYNLAHVIGNVVFCLLIGPPFVRALRRYRRRFEVSWPVGDEPSVARRPAAGVAGLLVAIACAAAAFTAGAAEPDAARAASASERGATYLRAAQNRDGGFSGAEGQGSTQLFTGWAALGLAAGDRNPRDVRRGGKNVVEYVRGRADALDDVGELERTILVLASSGLSPRSFAGRDLVAELVRRGGADGSFGGKTPLAAFAVLALRASGERASSQRVRAIARWVADQQNDDGGFGAGRRGGASDVDDTGAALQALAAANRDGGVVEARAIDYLGRVQNANGGFPQSEGGDSNAQSTSWAIQGLLAVGRSPESFRRPGGRDPLAYLTSLQQSDGSFRYSRTSAQTPVWVTAQALTALERKPFPLAAVERAREGSKEQAGGSARATAAARKRKQRSRQRARAAAEPDPPTRTQGPSTSPVGLRNTGARSGEPPRERGSALAAGIAALASGAALFGMRRYRGHEREGSS